MTSQAKISTLTAMLLVALGGCSGSAGSGADGAAGTGGGGGGNGGSGGGNGGSGGSGGSTDGGADAGGPACPGVSPVVTVLDSIHGADLNAVGDDVVFMDLPTNLTDPVKIRKVHRDGTGDVVLHTAPADHVPAQIHPRADGVLFLDDDFGSGAAHTLLFRVPLAGGTATPVSTTAFPDGRIIGSDATYAYVTTVGATGDAGFVRVKLATGVVETIGTETSGTPLNMQLAAGTLYFSRPIPSTAMRQLAKLPADGTGATAMDVGMIMSGANCLLGIMPTSVTASSILCSGGIAGEKLVSWNLAGSTASVLIDLGLGKGRLLATPPDGDAVYLLQTTLSSTDRWPLLKLKVSDSSRTTVACNLARIPQRLFRKAISVPDAYEFTTGASDVFWIEGRQEGAGAETVKLMRAPK